MQTVSDKDGGKSVMTKNTSFFSMLIILLLIFALGYLYWEKETVTTYYKTALDKEQKNIEELKGALSKEQADKGKKEFLLQDLQAKYDQLKADFNKAQNDFKGMEAFRDNLISRLEKLDATTGKNLEKIEYVAQKMDMQKIATPANVPKTTLNVQEKINGIELPAVVVKGGQQNSVYDEKAIENKENNSLPMPKSEAQIMSVNEEYNFLVINKGLVDGVKNGDQFKIEQNKEEVAKISISEVRDFVSLGTIEYTKKGVHLKKEDIIREYKQL
jgi:hypothetical protein